MRALEATEVWLPKLVEVARDTDETLVALVVLEVWADLALVALEICVLPVLALLAEEKGERDRGKVDVVEELKGKCQQ